MLSEVKLKLDQLLGQMRRLKRQIEQERRSDAARILHKEFGAKIQWSSRWRNCHNCGKSGHVKAACWLPGGGAHFSQQTQFQNQGDADDGTATASVRHRSSATTRIGSEQARKHAERGLPQQIDTVAKVGASSAGQTNIGV